MAGGGRVVGVVEDPYVLVRGYKVRKDFAPALYEELSIGVDSVSVHEDGLRFNKGGFGVDKSGKRKREGFNGDEGERQAKNFNRHELLLFDTTETDALIQALDIFVTPRSSNRLTGQLLVLEQDDEELYVIVDVIELTDLTKGGHTYELDDVAQAIAILGSGKTSVQLDVALHMVEQAEEE
ncbi:MAG: hypothetical protein AAFO91_10035 [Bacteroidota bacterium]